MDLSATHISNLFAAGGGGGGRFSFVPTYVYARVCGLVVRYFVHTSRLCDSLRAFWVLVFSYGNHAAAVSRDRAMGHRGCNNRLLCLTVHGIIG